MKFETEMKALAAIVLCIALTVAAQQRHSSPGPQANPVAGQPQAIEAGHNIFRETCSVCHGAFGEGGQGGEGQGPNLITSGRVQRSSDADLFGIIQHGVPGSAMPAFRLPAAKTWALISYLRTLSATAITLNVPGNVEAGGAVFYGKGQCADCHMIGGKGGFLGPDLSDVGARSRLDQLRDAVLEKTQGGSTSGDLYGDPQSGYRAVLLTLPDGATIEAVAKHYSNYSIQVLDKAGNLHMLRGADMKRAEFRSKSWMPDDYGRRLSAQELQDLLAYLSRQSIRPPVTQKQRKVPAEGDD